MTRTSLVSVLVATTSAALLVGATPAAAEDWLSVRGGPGQNPARAFAPGNDFGRAWVSATASPERPECVVAASGRLFSLVASEDDPALVRLAAFRANDGTQLWATPEFPKYTPTCPGTDGQRVFVGSGYRATSPVTHPAFTAYDAKDGQQVWKHVFGPGGGYGATQGSPVALDGQVHVQASDGTCGSVSGVVIGCTFTFDAAAGTLVSRTEVSSTSGAPYAAWHPVVDSGVVIGRNPLGPEGAYNVLARHLDDGSVAWQEGADSGTPVATDGVVYYVRRPGWPYDGPQVVVARDAATGSVLWERDLVSGQHAYDLVVGPDAVHIAVGYQNANLPGRLVTVTRADGAPMWSAASATSGAPRGLYVLGSDVYAEGQVFTSTGSRSAAAIPYAASPNDGAAYVDGTFYFWDSVNGGPARLVALRDVTAPSVGTDAPAGTTYTTAAMPTFGWHAGDGTGSGLASTQVVLPGGGSGVLAANATSWQSTSALADGHYTWTVRVTDRVGNTAETAARTLVVDTVAPSGFDLGLPDGVVVRSLAETGLTWATAQDATAGVDRYEVILDGAPHTTVPASACGPTSCAAPPSPISDGSHTWAVRAIDRAGHTITTLPRRLDVSIPPVATVAVTPSRVLTGQNVRLEPAGSADDNGTIQRIEWDLDGNGGNDTTTAGTTATTTRFATPGPHTVTMRVVDTAGLSATASTTVDVRPAPPTGEVGISINNGDIATNDPKVGLSLVWPEYASHTLVSNDGGFGSQGGTALLPLASDVAWKLQSSGPERLPKTVYLRFRGAGSDTLNFTDDIILDESVPELTKATMIPVVGRSRLPAADWHPRQAAAGKFRIRVVGTDKASGISRVVVSPTKKLKKGKFVTLRSRTKLGIRKLDKTITVTSGKAPKWVCVLDSAGNPSRWKAL